MNEQLRKQLIEIVKKNQPIFIKDILETIDFSKEDIQREIEYLCRNKIFQLRQEHIYLYDNNPNVQVVEDLMMVTRTVKSDVSIGSAITTMILEDIDFLIITKDMNLEGVLSKKDIIRRVIMEHIDITNTSVDEIMTKNPNIIYAQNTEKVALVIEKLIQNDIDSIPIVKVQQNEDGQKILKVIGVFNKTIITKLYRDLHKN